MTTLGIAIFLALVLAILLTGGIWIAMALGITAWIAFAAFTSSPPDINLFTSLWRSAASWELAALPLFIWMGEILFRSNLSREMYSGLAPWLNWLPGRLMHTTILGCGIFGSVSGSSAATCATIAKVALPELTSRGYDEKTALGALAVGGTLGILIPPSITMVVYAVAADASILKVFLAGFLPGLLLIVLFSGYIIYAALRHPERFPQQDLKMTLWEKINASRNLIPCILLIVLVCWTLIAGIATATECAAWGVLGALILAAWSKSLSWSVFKDSLCSTMRTSCMIMFILGCASFLTAAMGFTKIPMALADYVQSLGLSKYTLIAVLAMVYILLGAALDGISMIVLTTSIVLPMVERAGFDLVWFGIFVVLMIEIAEITPPVGFNLFVLQNMTGRDSLFVAKASMPFFWMMVVAIILVTIFPEIATWLPDYVIDSTRKAS